MTEVKNPNSMVEELEPPELPVIDGELIEDSPSTSHGISKVKEQKAKTEIKKPEQKAKNREQIAQNDLDKQFAIRNYLLLPIIFLTVTLLGGLRLSIDTNAFVFLKPELLCLIFASILLVLFFKTELIKLAGWFSESFSTFKNLANAAVLFTLFTASVQVFNSLLPEKGFPFWMVALLFFWTLWNNIFSVFTAKRMVQSLGSLFGLAFVLKYLVLTSLTAPTSDSWLRGLLENPTKEVFTYLLDLPRYSTGTGYIQFFTVVFYVIGLFLLSPVSTRTEETKMQTKTVEVD